MRVSVVLVLVPALATSQRAASVHEVQPTIRDSVHTVWLNGPSSSAQLGGGWPAFDSGSGSTNGQCTTHDDSFTGYTSGGSYCEPSSPEVDDNALLVMHSGHIAVVVDAAGFPSAVVNTDGGGCGSAGCSECEGDCDSDSQCAGDLECFQRTSSSDTVPGCEPTGYLMTSGNDWDYCYDPGRAASSGLKSLIPKLGATGGLPATTSARAVYDALPALDTSEITMTTTCADPANSKTYVLGTSEPKFAQVGLVRQGVTMTQISVTALEWRDSTTSELLGPCAGFVPTQETAPWGAWPAFITRDRVNGRCNQNYGGASWPCPSQFPTCVGFVQGSGWGSCYDECLTEGGDTELWVEISVWGDSVSLVVAWDNAFQLPAGCTGTVDLAIDSASDGLSASRSTALSTGAGSVSAFITVPQQGSDPSQSAALLADDDANAAQDPVFVTASTAGATVVTRGDDTRDVFVEVPTGLPRCGYNTACANYGLSLVHIVATNPHPTEHRTLRLSFSRNFETKRAGLSQQSPSAEITGFSAQLWDTAVGQASGISMQTSKNWHSGSSAAFWAGYAGMWWTASSLIRLPPNSSIPLSLAYNVELYGGVPAFSHAQLSIVGYSNKFLWEEAALGSGGENICFDPLGSHTRATITDMRPKLFDGAWKENVGGGDFLPLFFGSDGALQYFKELDPQLHANGPCLSNSSYAGVTRDGAVSSRVEISGGRTDDLVRVFFHVQLRVLSDTDFTRLALFQLGSETYNYNSEFTEFVVGGAGVADAHTPRACTGGTSRDSSKLYDSPGPKRTAMAGAAPWWFALGPNEHATAFTGNNMVVGDRGLVVRSFSGQLGGVVQSAPTFSVLCDKIELGTPAGLRSLVAGDFVDMMLEVLVLPRAGQEYEAARDNSGSNTLTNTLAGLATWERVKLQAELGHLAVTPENHHSRVESHYPVRVCAASPEVSTTSVMFEIEGAALGFVPITICGLATHAVPTGGTQEPVVNTDVDGCGSAGCSECEGDCDSNSQCAGNLECFQRTSSSHLVPGCASTGLQGTWDYCYDPGRATHGLWLKPEGDADFTLLTQGSSGLNDFWQTNYDRVAGTYEIVYNVELLGANRTMVAFGSHPDLWATSSPTPAPVGPMEFGEAANALCPNAYMLGYPIHWYTEVGEMTAAECAAAASNISSFGWFVDNEALVDLSRVKTCYVITEAFNFNDSLSFMDDDDTSDDDFWVTCRTIADAPTPAPRVPMQFSEAANALCNATYRLGHPEVDDQNVGEMTAAECAALAASVLGGTSSWGPSATIFGWYVDNEALVNLGKVKTCYVITVPFNLTSDMQDDDDTSDGDYWVTCPIENENVLPACVCEQSWTSPSDGGVCNETQFGCPSSDCDEGGSNSSWCIVANAPCATGRDLLTSEPWSYCDPADPNTFAPTPAPTPAPATSEPTSGPTPSPTPAPVREEPCDGQPATSYCRGIRRYWGPEQAQPL